MQTKQAMHAVETKPINSRDRMKAVLSGTLPDRVPFFPTIYVDHACLACGKSFEDALIDPALGQECMLGAAVRYQTDAVRFCMGPPATWYEEKRVAQLDGKLAQFSRRSGALEGHYDVAGGGAFLPLEKPKPLGTIAEVDQIPVPSAEEYWQQGCFKDVARCVQDAHDRGLFAVGLCSGQTINFMVEKMGGSEPALIGLLRPAGVCPRPDRQGGGHLDRERQRLSSEPASIASTSAIPTRRRASFRRRSTGSSVRRLMWKWPASFTAKACSATSIAAATTTPCSMISPPSASTRWTAWTRPAA